MSLAKASLWTAASTLVKIGAGLLVVKLLAVSFGPAGVGEPVTSGNWSPYSACWPGPGYLMASRSWWRSITTIPRLKQVVGTSSAMVLGFSTLLALVFLLAAAPISRAVRPYALSGAGTPGGAGADGDRLGEFPAGAD